MCVPDDEFSTCKLMRQGGDVCLKERKRQWRKVINCGGVKDVSFPPLELLNHTTDKRNPCVLLYKLKQRDRSDAN